MQRFGRKRVIASTVLVVGVVVGALVTPGSPARLGGRAGATSSPWGLRAGFAAGAPLRWESDSDLGRDFDAMAATGAKWVRFDVDWPSVQSGGPASFWWGQIDRMVLAARARGMQVLGTLAYTPGWARPPGCSSSDKCAPGTPAGIAAYAAFAGKATERYGATSTLNTLKGSIGAWEIWNEPNHAPFWQPRPSLDNYTAMLGQAYTAIKAADPAATVVTGGTSPAPDAADGSDIAPATWLAGLYARGAKASFDAVGHHPYAFPYSPLGGQPWNAYTQTQYLYNVMLAQGDGTKKIWGTESGAPTGTASQATSEAGQAQSISEYYSGWNTTYAAFTGPLLVYKHRDDGTNPADLEQNFGLLHNDFSPKPAYATFMQLMSAGSLPRPANPSGGSWSGWGPLGGVVGSGTGVASWAVNRLDVFAGSSDGTLQHTCWVATFWCSWENLGGTLVGDPAAASWAANRIDVFGAGVDGGLRHRWWDGVQWAGWEDLGGQLSSGPAVASWAANRLDVFARAPDGQLQHKWWTGTAWSGWENLGGVLVGNPAAVSWGPNRIDVFARGTDNQLYHQWWDGTHWSGWEPLGGVLAFGPAVASWAADRLDVFVSGTDSQLWHKWWDGTGWRGYEPLGGVLTSAPGAVSWAPNQIDVFVRGTDNQLWQKYWG